MGLWVVLIVTFGLDRLVLVFGSDVWFCCLVLVCGLGLGFGVDVRSDVGVGGLVLLCSVLL